MGGLKRDMDKYVFKDAAPGRVRCMQCALYYEAGSVHECPAKVKNVYRGGIFDEFKARRPQMKVYYVDTVKKTEGGKTIRDRSPAYDDFEEAKEDAMIVVGQDRVVMVEVFEDGVAAPKWRADSSTMS